jgi:hypothetical protein
MCAEHSENINRKWPRNHYFWVFRLSAVSVPQSHLAALRFLDDLDFERSHLKERERGARSAQKRGCSGQLIPDTLPDGSVQPQKVSTVSTVFVRAPKVRTWVLREAKGICEGCGSNAPFKVDGLPFLEVHHVKHLAQKGSDRLTNAVALCSNCHQRCHRSRDRDEFTAGLYSKISRLIQE